MSVPRLCTLALLPLLAVALAAPARASIAIPPSGTPINLFVGETFTVKLKNAGGCTFDYTASVMDPLRIGIASASGMDVKGASIVLTALAPGETELMIQSMNGSCPPALHTYPVTVLPDLAGIMKTMDLTVKTELKTFKHDVKLAYVNYSWETKDLATSFKLGALTDDTLQDGFHSAAVNLRNDIFVAGSLAYTHVIGTGTQLFADNGLTGQAPMGLFAGGGGSYDTFQQSVCGEFAGFHANFDKASSSAIKGFGKLGAPRYGQWDIVPPIFAGGPYYPSQAGAFGMPQPLTGPMTFTLRPTTNLARDNGRLLVSGRASSLLAVPYHVTLTREELGQAPVITDTTPPVVGDEWIATFASLKEGAYKLSTGYENDTVKVELPIAVSSQDP